MARLTDDIKLFIVQRLAMFDTPSQVAEAVKEEFGVEVLREHVRFYNPEQSSPAKKWRAIHAATRTEFLKETANIGVANRAVRLRAIERVLRRAEKRQNDGLVLVAAKQAAEEVGDVYTNNRNLKHSGEIAGGVLAIPVPVTPDGKPLDSAAWSSGAAAQQSALKISAAAAASSATSTGNSP